MAKETYGPISSKEMAFALQRLDAIVASFAEFKKYSESISETDPLWVWRFRSLEDGLVRLESICPELRRSVHAHVTGNPQGPDSKKSKKP